MAVSAAVDPVRPRCLATDAIDLDRVHVSSDPPSDEFLFSFGGKLAPSSRDPIASPGNDAAAVMVDLHPDDSSSGAIVASGSSRRWSAPSRSTPSGPSSGGVR